MEKLTACASVEEEAFRHQHASKGPLKKKIKREMDIACWPARLDITVLQKEVEAQATSTTSFSTSSSSGVAGVSSERKRDFSTTMASSGTNSNWAFESRDDRKLPHTSRIRLPEKLMVYLNQNILPHTLWWVPDTDGFALDTQTIQAEFLDKHFQGTKLASFIRSLNRWGFRRIPYLSLPDTALSFHHPLFQKNNPGLMIEMKMNSYCLGIGDWKKKDSDIPSSSPQPVLATAQKEITAPLFSASLPAPSAAASQVQVTSPVVVQAQGGVGGNVLLHEQEAIQNLVKMINGPSQHIPTDLKELLQIIVGNQQPQKTLDLLQALLPHFKHQHQHQRSPAPTLSTQRLLTTQHLQQQSTITSPLWAQSSRAPAPPPIYPLLELLKCLQAPHSCHPEHQPPAPLPGHGAANTMNGCGKALAGHSAGGHGTVIQNLVKMIIGPSHHIPADLKELLQIIVGNLQHQSTLDLLQALLPHFQHQHQQQKIPAPTLSNQRLLTTQHLQQQSKITSALRAQSSCAPAPPPTYPLLEMLKCLQAPQPCHPEHQPPAPLPGHGPVNTMNGCGKALVGHSSAGQELLHRFILQQQQQQPQQQQQQQQQHQHHHQHQHQHHHQHQHQLAALCNLFLP